MECWLFGARDLCQWGPSGGDGCRGWNASVEVGGSMNSSFPFRNIMYYRTGRGVHGQGMSMDGATGEDVMVKVQARMVARESGNEEVLLWSCLVGEGILRKNGVHEQVVEAGAGAKAGRRCWNSGCPKCLEKHTFECHKVLLSRHLQTILLLLYFLTWVHVSDSSSQQPEFEFILFVLSWKC
ncbi:hypothetical protein NC651_021386 [Populus alba x Populus x berolinensis]|nr:hypothetical protein NC651_021386 [Populus alba x Populus x berolinensis]